MILFRLLPLKQVDRPLADFQNRWERGKTLHEVVIVTIESAVILAALHVAWGQDATVMVIGAYCLTYITLGLYLLGFFDYVVNAFAEERGFAHSNRNLFLWIAGLGSLAVSVSLPYFLSAMIAEFVKRNFLQ